MFFPPWLVVFSRLVTKVCHVVNWWWCFQKDRSTEGHSNVKAWNQAAVENMIVTFSPRNSITLSRNPSNACHVFRGGSCYLWQFGYLLVLFKVRYPRYSPKILTNPRYGIYLLLPTPLPLPIPLAPRHSRPEIPGRDNSTEKPRIVAWSSYLTFKMYYSLVKYPTTISFIFHIWTVKLGRVMWNNFSRK